MVGTGIYLFCFGALGGIFVYLLMLFVVLKSTSGVFRSEGFWGWHDAIRNGAAVRTKKNRVLLFVRNLIFILALVIFSLTAVVGLTVVVFSLF